MNLRNLLIVIATGLSAVFSCVPNKQVVYLQGEQLEATVKVDSLVRNYPRRTEEYTLEPGDVVSINVGSLTEEEFNFVQIYEQQLGFYQYLQEFQFPGMNMGGGMNMNMMGGGQQGMGDNIVTSRLQGFKIDQEGKLELPVIGSVEAVGLTTRKLESLLQQKLTGYFEEPIVRVQHLSFNFTVVGEVMQPGRYNTLAPQINIIEALSIAGNPSEFADRSNVKIVREEEGQNKIIYLNLLREEALASPYFYLKPGDLVIVSPLRARFTARYAFPNLTQIIGTTSSLATLIFLIVQFSSNE